MSPFRGPRVCRPACFLRHTVLRLGVLLVAAIGELDAVVQAAPVTFRFEAEITSISRSSDATFDLPSNAMIGDILSGMLQFEPFGFGLSVGVSNLKVNLGTEVFSAEGTPLTPSITAFAIDPIGLYSIRDNIDVGCTGISSCAAVVSSLSNDLELANLSLGLSGVIVKETSEYGLIRRGESLGDPDVWNRLSDRQLRMEFTSNLGPGSIQLEAVIGPMAVVPEPSSLILIMIGVIGMTRQLLLRRK